MKFLVRKELGGFRKVLQKIDGERWPELVADFANSVPGDMAYAGFVRWVAVEGHELFDEDRGEYVAGPIGKLDGEG